MIPKKILIVTKGFYPDISPRSFRAFELAKELARQGHHVTVLTTQREYNYSSLEQEYQITIKAIVNNEPAELVGTSVKRVIRYALGYFFLYPSILLTKYFYRALKEETQLYDILISIAHPYPVHFAVAFAKARYKTNLTKLWIADCGDPLYGNQEGRIKNPFYYLWLEKWFGKRADYITIPIKEAIQAYHKQLWNKIRVIPQGFDFSEIKPNYIEGANHVVTFAYAGMLSPGLRDPRPFLDLLIELDRNFKFIIFTRNKGFIETYQKSLGEKLEIRDFIPRNELLAILGQMDFLVNLENKNEVQKPSKLIDYALLERPILSLRPFAIDRNIVSEFLNRNYQNSLEINDVHVYNIHNVANRFLQLGK